VYSHISFAEKQLLVMLEFRKSRFLHPLTKTRQSYCIKLVCLNIFPALL